MSSIMRRRSGLMAISVIGGSCLEDEVANPSILRTGRRPHYHPFTSRRSSRALPCAQRPPARAGSFSGTKRSQMCSRPAEGLLDTLMRRRRTGVSRELRLVLVGLGENRQKFLEWRKVLSLHSSRDDCFDAMVARDVSRVDGPHRSPARGGVLRLLGQPLPPARSPPVKSSGIDEQVADGPVAVRTDRCIAEPPEREREVGLVLGHGPQQIACERRIALLLREQPELLPESALVGQLKLWAKPAQRFLRLCDRLVLLFGQERQKRLGQPGQVPKTDARLVAVSVAAPVVDRAEHRRGII